MKKIILLPAILFFAAACQKTQTPREVNNSLIGKWKLSEFLSDPGDGSGTWQLADPLQPQYVEFKNDGTLLSSPNNLYNSDRYQVTSDSTMILFRGSNSLNLRYHFSTTLLSLHPPCREFCGKRYIPVRQ